MTAKESFEPMETWTFHNLDHSAKSYSQCVKFDAGIMSVDGPTGRLKNQPCPYWTHENLFQPSLARSSIIDHRRSLLG
jgi:hypothetical protein